VLQAYEYRPGMTIRDEDGSQLGFFPNEIVRDILSESKDPSDKSLLDEMNKRKKYLQWITLPKNNLLEPRKTRVITIEYSDTQSPKRRANGVSKLFFNIPEFDVKKNTPPTEDFPTAIVVDAPKGFRVRIEKCEAKVLWETSTRNLLSSDHYHQNKTDSMIDTNLPYFSNATVSLSMIYGIYPERSEQRALESFLAILIALSCFMLVLALQVSSIASLPGIKELVSLVTPQIVMSRLSLVGGAIAFVSLAFIGLTGNPVTQRTKYWAALALIIATSALLLLPSTIRFP
jgi:hypothetical protein